MLPSERPSDYEESFPRARAAPPDPDLRRLEMDGMSALYLFTLAAFTGYEIIMRVPVILHTPLMSGSNFVHGVVLVGAMASLGSATTPFEQTLGFIAVLLGAANAAGGYVVTERMLAMFKPGKSREAK
jgi:NAD(P) transhydrogenase subunit alpha